MQLIITFITSPKILEGGYQVLRKCTWQNNGAQHALKNAGAEKILLQECMVPHWVRGGQDKAFIIYKDEKGKQQKYWLNILALGNSVGTGAGGVQAPMMRVNNFDELEAKKNDLKGKIVFYNNPFDDTLINTFYAYGKNVIYRSIGASRAAKYDAVGCDDPEHDKHAGELSAYRFFTLHRYNKKNSCGSNGPGRC